MLSPPLPKPIARNLAALAGDYARVTGAPPAHFHCPILGVDEPAQLCRGHIVPRAVAGRRSPWIVQRTDVDNRLGSFTESAMIGVGAPPSRPATILALLKAAHLTLFSLAGYGYALSPLGLHIGPGTLGRYLRETESMRRRDALAHAALFIRQIRGVSVVAARAGAPGSLTTGLWLAVTDDQARSGADVRVAIGAHAFTVRLRPADWTGAVQAQALRTPRPFCWPTTPLHLTPAA